MDTTWQTFGHNRAKNILDKQLASGRLPHAYLFSGPQGLGKKTLALELAGKILKAQKLDNHPDFQILDIEGEITTELILDFISRLSFKPFLGQKKVAFINNAQNLNTQSSNALLKTLEEPSESTILVLIATPQSLLPTIVSRCQVFNFQPFAEARLKEFAEQNSFKAGKEILSLSFGKIGRLKHLAENHEFLAQQTSVVESFQHLSKQNRAEKILAIAGYADLEPGDLQDKLLGWLSWQAADLKNEPKNFLRLSALSDALLSLKKNQNKKLVLQSLFLKL